MKEAGLYVSKIVVFLFCLAIALFFLLAEDVTAAKDYWCKYKDQQMYEQKYDDVNKIQDDIDNNPGSYWGMCDIYNDLGAYLGGDQTGDGNYAQGSEEIAICHYDGTDGTWHQVYEDYTGYLKALYCKYRNGEYENKLEKKYKIDQKVADNPGSHLGLCTPADVPMKNNPPKSMVWCKYEVKAGDTNGTWKTINDTPSDVAAPLGTGTGLADFPGSHRGGCTYHEWHTNDYWGHCTDTAISDSTVAPAPPSDMVIEKREGPGVGDGHTTGKRCPKPRIRYKSKNRVNPK